LIDRNKLTSLCEVRGEFRKKTKIGEINMKKSLSVLCCAGAFVALSALGALAEPQGQGAPPPPSASTATITIVSPPATLASIDTAFHADPFAADCIGDLRISTVGINLNLAGDTGYSAGAHYVAAFHAAGNVAAGNTAMTRPAPGPLTFSS
jgi:hypothetical protein